MTKQRKHTTKANKKIKERKRGIKKDISTYLPPILPEPEPKPPLDETDFLDYYEELSLNSIADFILGLNYFDPTNQIIKKDLSKIIIKFQNELLIPAIEETEEKIKLHYIIDTFEVQNKIEKYDNINVMVLYRLNLFRNLYPNKKVYLKSCIISGFFITPNLLEREFKSRQVRLIYFKMKRYRLST